MKKFFIWIIIICTIFIFAYAFSASYNSQNIDRLDYVIALGIDKTSDNNLKVSYEFTDLSSFSDSSSSEKSKPIIDTVVAPSIPEAVNLMNAYAGKQVNLSHCKVVIFSEDVAKEGILEEVTYLMNDPQIRPTTNVIVASEQAKDYIDNSTSSLEGILTKYYDIFPTSAEYTGYTSNILLSRFYQNLTNHESGAVAILGTKSTISSKDSSQSSAKKESSVEGSSNQNETTLSNNISLESVSTGETIVEGDRGTENIGLAVFNADKYIGNLSAIETLCYTLIEDEVDNFSVRIDNPSVPDQKINLSVSSLEPAHTKVDTSKENPIITIKFNLTAKASTGQNSLDFSNKDTLEVVNATFKEFLTSKMKDFLNKTSREYKCDINRFYKLVKQQFLTIPEYEIYNWEEKYQNAEFNIEIDSNVTSSFLVQNS